MTVNFKTDSLKKHEPLTGEIKKSLTVEGSTIKETESHFAYFQNLPEQISKEQVETLAKYNNQFVQSSHIAVGELATEAMLANPDLTRMDAKLGFFGPRDSVEMTVHRDKTYRNNFAENEEDKELKKSLVMNTSINTSGYGLKAIKDSMSEEAKGLFAK